MKPVKIRSTCPVSFTLDFFGDKWTLLILRDMIVHNKRSYGEFLKSEEKIATNILADRLAALEENGFVTRKVSPEKETKFIYTMTEKAIDLFPVIAEMYLWGSKYSTVAHVEEPIQKELKKDKANTIKKHINKLLAQSEMA